MTAEFLQRFCGTEEMGSYDLSKPIVLGPWKYATDGRICIRVKADPGEPQTDREVQKYPINLDSVRRTTLEALQPWTVPAEYVQGPVDCVRCNGEGYVGPTDAATPVGAEGETCPACDGNGSVTGDYSRTIGGKTINAKYDRLILTLAPVVFRPESDHHKPMYFEFDGGQGLICGITPDATRR